MANAFDRFDAEAMSKPQAGNPFDEFDEQPAGNPFDAFDEVAEAPAPEPYGPSRTSNAGRSFPDAARRERSGDSQPQENYDSFVEATGKSLDNVPERLQLSFGGLVQMLGEDMGQERERFMQQSARRLGITPQEYKLLAWAGNEGLVDPETPVPNALESLKSQMLTELTPEQQAQVADMGLINPDRVADKGRELRADAQSTMEPVNAEPGSAAYYTSAAIGSIAEMTPALLASVLTRNPATGMSIIGGQVGGESYGRARDSGKSVDEAQTYAMAQAAAEAIPEYLPISTILKPGANFLGKLAKTGAAESVQEMLTAALQAGIDKEIIQPDMTWGEARQQIIDGGIIGLIAGPGMAAMMEPVIRLQDRNKPTQDESAPPVAEGEVPAEPSPVESGATTNPFDAFDEAEAEPAPVTAEQAAVDAVEPQPAQQESIGGDGDTGPVATPLEHSENLPGEPMSVEEVSSDAGLESESIAAEQKLETDSLPQEDVETVVSTPTSRKVEQAGADTNTEPTEGQKAAGNYKKGRVRIQGLDIAIENPKGSTRSGTDPDGNRWESTMAHHYGDIKGTKAADGDNLDVFIGPYPEIDQVFVIDQPKADGSFDEHKILLGYANEKEAREGYLANYEKGWKAGPITRMSMDDFKDWVRNGNTQKPLNTSSFSNEGNSSERADLEVEAAFSRSSDSPQTLGALKKSWNSAGVEASVSEKTGVIRLDKIVVPEQQRRSGVGSRDMQELTDYADATGQTIALSPSSDFGGNKLRLRKFYRRFGFVENKGKKKDFEISESMYRPPNSERFSREAGYRRTPEYQRNALTVEQAESIRDELMNGWKGAPDVIVRDQIDQFPPGLQAAIRLAGAENDMRGVFWSDTVYILASRIPDRMRMEQVILHEVIGHYGLRKMLGKDMERVLNQIWMAHGGQKRAEFIIKRYFPGNSFDVNNKEHRHTVAEELIAHLAEQNRGQTLAQRAVAIIREGLRKLGFTLEFTVDDIVNLINGARRTVERGGFEVDSAVSSEAVAASRSEQGNDSGDSEIPPNFRFSRTGVPDLDPQPFGPPSDTLIRKAVSKIADKFTVLKGVQKNIQDIYGEIPESANAYRAEELFHGKVENDIRLIEENMVEPLAKAMSENDVSLKQLDEFLYALHAPERNRVIAERNPEIPEGGSGMTDAEAAEIINKIEKSGKLKQYQALAKRVHDMLAMRRKILRNAGLLDEETVGAWEASYKHYVPLKGWAADEQQSDMPRIGKGFAIAGKESQMAAGRKSRAASPLANTISDLSEAVLRRRKNEVGNAFMNLVEAYPNGSYWQVYTDENPEVQRKAVRVKDPETGKARVEVREQTVPMTMMSDRYFTTKRDGKTYYIKIEDKRLMNAMRNIGPDNSNLLIRSLAAATRIMSSLNTSYNPEFVVSNFSRDIQTALLNLSSEQSSEDGKARGKKIVAKTLRDTGTAFRAINASLKGKQLTGKAGEWQRYFEEFRKDGAKTGWFDMKDIDGQMKDLERMISLAGGNPVSARGLRRGFNAITDWVENSNSAIENGVRLSAYVNAIQAGIPRSQAASLAKNMTVNFNRKGELGTTMNALYMFANASVQGTANFVRTLGRLNGVKGDPIWQRMHTAHKIAAGMALGGFMLSLLNRLVAGEDDDEVNWWDKVPDYVKERNIVIMKSLVGGDPGEYWTIPLPYGYNIFPVIGTQMEHVLFSETQTIGDAASNVILAALGSFSPIGFEQSEEAYGVIAKNIMPTILRPVASISLNENFMGGPIFKENFPFGTPKPDSALYFRSTPEAFKALAEGLNEATGGNEQMSGAVDLSPDVMQFLVGYYGGGAYDFFTSRGPNFAVKAFTLQDMEAREIPFIRKVSGEVLPYEDQSKFYDRRDEINQIGKRYKALKDGERLQFYKDYRHKLRLKSLVDSTEKRLSKLREKRDYIEMMDLTAAEEDEKLRQVEKQMKQAVDRFNKEYNESIN